MEIYMTVIAGESNTLQLCFSPKKLKSTVIPIAYEGSTRPLSLLLLCECHEFMIFFAASFYRPVITVGLLEKTKCTNEQETGFQNGAGNSFEKKYRTGLE